MKRKHSLDFMLNAIAMSNEKGTRSTTAQQLNININTLISWRSAYAKGKLTGSVPLPKYSLDFKLRAITMSYERRSIITTAHQLDINSNTLKYWRAKYRQEKFTDNPPFPLKYSINFKLDAIAMSNQRGNMGTVTQQLDISIATLRKWRSEYRTGKLTGIPSIVKKRKKYPLDFKLKAVTMSQKRGGIHNTCQQLNITRGELGYWRSEYRKGKFTKELPVSKKKYSLEFKLAAVAMSNYSGGVPITILHLGITEHMLRYWRAQYHKGILTDSQSIIKRKEKYSLEFKIAAIHMSDYSGVKATILHLSITENQLHYWRSQYRKGKFTDESPMTKSRKKYSIEFKMNAITMSNEPSTISSASQQLGISQDILAKWRSAYRKGKYIGKLPVPENTNTTKLLRLSNGSAKQEKEIKQLTLEWKILKKISQAPFLHTSKGKHQFIKQNSDIFPIKKMCRILKISPGAYYSWITRGPLQNTLRREMLSQEIRKIHSQHKGRYGSVRITKELKMSGIATTQFLVAKLMRESGLTRIPKKKFKITTNSAHQYLVSENLLQPKHTVTRQNEVWVSDITYIRISPTGWLYLTIILDLFDRKIIGWSLNQTLKTKDTIIEAFRKAVANRPILENLSLIFHSDRGVQYACNGFISELHKHPSILQSMSRKGNCWDNAIAESFFGRLKTELVYQTTYKTTEQAQESIADYIENYYNTNRRHSALNYLTITEFHKLTSNDLNNPTL